MAVTMWGQTAIQATMPQEDPIQVGSLWIDTSGTATLKVCTAVSPYTFSEITGGAGTPGGSDTQVQFNDDGDFAGHAGLTFDKTTGQLRIGTGTPSITGTLLSVVRNGANAALALLEQIATDACVMWNAVLNTSGTADMTHLVAHEIDLYHSGSGTVDIAYSLNPTLNNEAAGIISLAAAIGVDTIGNNGAGSITEAIGLLIADQTEGDTNYAIKTGVGLVDFGDDVRVNGDLRLVGQASKHVLGTDADGDLIPRTLSETLDLIGSAAQGDVLYRGAAGWERLGVGTDKQFLQTQGSGANPQWANASIILDRDVAQQEVVSTTTETAVYSFTVPGGTLGTNRALRLTFAADYLNNDGGSRTLRIQIKLGATTIFDSGTQNVTNNASRYGIEARCFISAANATNAQRAATRILVSGAGSAAGVHVPAFAGWASTHNAIAEDSTADKTLQITVTHGTSSANISFIMRTVHLERL